MAVEKYMTPKGGVIGGEKGNIGLIAVAGGGVAATKSNAIHTLPGGKVVELTDTTGATDNLQESIRAGVGIVAEGLGCVGCAVLRNSCVLEV